MPSDGQSENENKIRRPKQRWGECARDQMLFKIACVIIILHSIFAGCLFVFNFLWPQLRDASDRLTTHYVRSDLVPCTLIDFGFRYFRFSAFLPYLKLMCVPASHPYWIMHFCGEIWWERETKETKNQMNTHGSGDCTQTGELHH